VIIHPMNPKHIHPMTADRKTWGILFTLSHRMNEAEGSWDEYSSDDSRPKDFWEYFSLEVIG